MLIRGILRNVLTVSLVALGSRSATAEEVPPSSESTTIDAEDGFVTYAPRIHFEGNMFNLPSGADSKSDEGGEAILLLKPEKTLPEAKAPEEEREEDSGNATSWSAVEEPLGDSSYFADKPVVEPSLKDKLEPIIMNPFPKPPFSLSDEIEKVLFEIKKEYPSKSEEEYGDETTTEGESATEATDKATDPAKPTDGSQTTSTSTPKDSTDSVTPAVTSHPSVPVPLCCSSEPGDWESCLRQSSESVHLLPVAFSHCHDPVDHFVRFSAQSDICPNRNITKVFLSRENRLVYARHKMFFYWNMIFVDDFCVELPASANDPYYKVLVCSSVESSNHPELCVADVCHSKCCPEGYLLQDEYCVCYDYDTPFVGRAFVGRNRKRGLLAGIHKPIRFEKCESPDVITGNSSTNKGSLKFGENESALTVTDSSLDYCVDRLLDVQGSRNIVSTSLAVVLCPQSQEDYESTWAVVRRVLIPLGLVVSCVFLAATLLCHLCLPPLRDLRGLYLSAYVASLLVADSALFTTQAFAQFLAPASCVTLALILHVAFLSTFFWLNVICYDVWTYVRLSVQGVPLHRTQDDMARLLLRGGYAWGCPLLIGIVAAVMQLLPVDDDEYLKPNFVENRCWFRDGDEILAYFYGPMGILCVVNTLLILHTGAVLYCANNRCHCFFTSCGQTNHTFDRQHLNEFWQRFGLFAIMASCWLTEVISSIVGSGDSELWAVTDTLNTFQGVFIFITFIRSTKRRRLVQEKLEAWMERVERGGLPAPSLPSAIRPGNLIRRLRNSAVWSSVAEAWGAAPCRRRPHLSSKQVLDNIIFKEKMEDRKGFNNQAFEEEEEREEEEEEEEEEEAVESGFSREDPANRSASPIWTVPRWTSLRSKTYFPNDVGDKASASNATQQDDDIVCENFADSLSIYSTYSQDLTQGASTLERSQRPIFPQWNLLRLKSGSLNLSARDLAGRTASGTRGDVVCQGLTRKDSLTKK